MNTHQLFEKLNPPQREAVNTLDGPLLVLAGAGSGKTRVVTMRIINLIQNGVDAREILGLTFTNKAANEMKERVRNLSQSNVLISTFHSLGARILRESIGYLGYKKDFNIYDEDDVDKVIKMAMLDAQVTDPEAEPKHYRQMISKAKNNLNLPKGDKTEEPLLALVYANYIAKMQEYNALDFDDLLFLPVRLFREHALVLQMYQSRWKYLLIDEYQDTNPVQYTFVSYLVEHSNNLCVVGDPDQSIYSWRGANIRNILDFEKDYPGAKVVRLEQNYRSRSNILEAANAVISQNEERYEKNLWSDRGPGEKIKHYTAETDRSEAEFIAEKIRHHHNLDRIPLNEMVVFYRTNSQSRVFEDCLLQKRIPYVIVGGISFYQRREVKDILAFLRMVQSGNDFVSFTRTINIPKRGFGETTIEKMRAAASQSGLSILGYSEALIDDHQLEVTVKLNSKQKEGLKNYVGIIRALKQLKETGGIKQLVEAAIEQSGYISFLSDDEESYEDRLGNLDSLIAKAIEWEMASDTPNLAAFLEELSLRSSLDEADMGKEHISLMTIHNGKGLEFGVAFLVGLEEELFPHANSRKTGDGVEEERRLFYVGMTRAKEFLYVTDVRFRFIWGTQRIQRPSRFLKEIPLEYLERIGKALYTKPTYQTREPFPIDEGVEEKFSDELSSIPDQKEKFSVGDAIFHKEFGVGVVREVYEGSLGLTYKIIFSKDNKEKNLVAKYASLVLL